MIFKYKANLLWNVAEVLDALEQMEDTPVTHHDIDLWLDTLKITENHGLYNDIISDEKVDQFLDDEVGNIDVYEELAAGVWCSEKNKALDLAADLELVEKVDNRFVILPSGIGLAKGMRFAVPLLRNEKLEYV